MRAAASPYDQGLMLSSEGRHLEAIERFEAALVATPEDPKILFALGNTASALGLPQPAEVFFRRVLAAEPGRLEALVNLGNLLRANGQFAAAIALLEPAAALEPQSPELALTLGSAFRENGDEANAVRWYRAALAARPDFAPALANLADLLCDAGARDEARTLYDQAIKATSLSGSGAGNAQARLNGAILHFLNGELKAGWRDYEARLSLPGKVPASTLRLPVWTGGSLKRTRLLVRAEQGVGDQILFASLIPELIAHAAAEGGGVILECEPRLVSLFARSFPGAAVKPAQLKTVNGAVMADYGWLKKSGGATAMIPMGSLAKYLRPQIGSFPNPHIFLTPDADETARWKNIFGAQAIGICWRSGKAGGHRAIQYAPLQAWGEFLRLVPGTPVSVQYDATPDEIAALEAISGRRIVVPQGIDQKQELDRACALLAALDAVVTAPTAVSWLAAGAGVPTFKILYDTSWTALGESHEPFAPSCVCVMPTQRGDWSDTFTRAKSLLTARL
jgi:tetratricopeptide (TPR) repeat protein